MRSLLAVALLAMLVAHGCRAVEGEAGEPAMIAPTADSSPGRPDPDRLSPLERDPTIR